MRIALLQIRLDARSRAANLQALHRAIDAAASVPDAPDLVVLPGACDTGGAASSRGCNRSTLEVVGESLAWQARQWGVFIAAGLHVKRDDAWEPCAVLFDPDGDIVVRSEHTEGGGSGEDQGRIEPWASPVGDLGAFEPTIRGPLAERIAARDRSAVIAVPTAANVTSKRRRAAEANLAELRGESPVGSAAYWAVVAEAGRQITPGDGNGPMTFLRAPGGTVLASAKRPDETIVRAEVPLAGAR